MKEPVAEEAILLDIYPKMRDHRPYIELFFKTRDTRYIHLVDASIPSGPRSNVLNYMYANRLQQFAVTDISRENGQNGRLVFQNYGVARSEYLRSLLKIGAFDIEVYNPRVQGFPDPVLAKQSVIAIVLRVGDTTKVFYGRPEREAINIMGFVDSLHELGPDILFTHNGDGFDFPTLNGRIERLKLPEYFKYWGLIDERIHKIAERAKFSVRQKQRAWSIPGRQHVDLLHFVTNYLKGMDSHLTTAAELYGIELPHHKQEEFYRFVDEEKMDIIKEHCEADVNKTYNVGQNIFPALVMQAQMTYAPLWMISRRRPAAMIELVADKALLDSGFRLSDLPKERNLRVSRREREKLRRRRFASPEGKIAISGLYSGVEISDLGLEYIEAAMRVPGMGALRRSAEVLKEKVWETKEMPSKLHRRSAYFMLFELGRQLDNLVRDPHSFYYRSDVGQRYEQEITQRVDALRGAFGSDIVFLDERYMIARFPGSNDMALVGKDGFVGRQGGVIIGRIPRKKTEPEYVQFERRGFIKAFFQGDRQTALEIYSSGKLAIEGGVIRPSLLAIQIPLKSLSEEQSAMTITETDRIIDELRGRYADLRPKEIVYAFKTVDGWIDLSREEPNQADTHYYLQLLDAAISPFMKIDAGQQQTLQQFTQDSLEHFAQ